MLNRRLVLVALCCLAGCGSSGLKVPPPTSTDMAAYGVRPGTPPANHRPVAAACPMMPTGSDCSIDSDCSSNQICACNAEPPAGPNRCVYAQCRVDSDCGSGGYCSPSSEVSSCGGMLSSVVSGYFCHTANDACSNDDDCLGTTSVCVYSPEGTTGLWVCGLATCGG